MNKTKQVKVLILAFTGLFCSACILTITPPLETPAAPGALAICHATGNSNSPYTELTLALDELPAHSQHTDDIIPAPAGGCPNELIPNSNDGKISLCHATNDPARPYNKITIALSGLSGHGQHKNDLILASGMEDCPMVTPTPTLTPTITLTVTATVAGETPTVTPTTTPTPEATVGSTDEKVTICHATGGKKKSYVIITVSVNGLNGHGKHKDDIIPAPAGGCP